MLSQQQIKREVWSVFGKDASKVEIGYEATVDGVFIRVSKVIDDDIIRLTHCLSSLELLQAYNPLAMLRYRISEMHGAFKHELKKKKAERVENEVSVKSISRT